MMDLSRRENITANRMHFIMLSVILVYACFIHLSHIELSFKEQKAKPSAVDMSPVAEEPVLAEAEEPEVDHFAFQIKKAEPLYNPIILEAANQHNVDLTMIKAIIMAESGFNKRSRSRHGAGGLMQLMPRTARSLGVKDLYDPEENIHAGVKYYKSLLDRFDGDEKLALAAYNAGARNVRKYKGVPPFRETRKYIKKVLSYQEFYKNGPAKELKSI